MKYIFVINSVISLATEVEAASLEEAINEAKIRSVQSLCYQCSGGSPEEWSMGGELDCDPSVGELVDFFVKGDKKEKPSFEDAFHLWGNDDI